MMRTMCRCWRGRVLVLACAVLLGWCEAFAQAAHATSSAGAPAASLVAQSRRPTRRSYEIPTWVWFVGGGVVLVVIAVIAQIMQKKKEGGGGGGEVAAPSSEGGGAVTGGASTGGGGGSGGIVENLGAYRLLNLMSTGQTSQVWEATEQSSGLHYAIKILLPEYATQKEHRNFLLHEAQIGIELAHPNIIKIKGVVEDPKKPHFIMDFFPGGSLKMRIMHKENDFIRQFGHEILKQTATAIAFMNAKGLVHRDIKPDNILVNSSGEVRVIDFAIAYRIPTGMARYFRRKGPVQGTRSYMSPEQIRNEELDARADIYSFGATAFEMVTGRPPFRGASAQELLSKHLNEKATTPKVFNPDVTDEFAELLLKMLSKKRQDRPNNFHEVLMAMRKIRIFRPEAVKKSTAS